MGNPVFRRALVAGSGFLFAGLAIESCLRASGTTGPVPETMLHAVMTACAGAVWLIAMLASGSAPKPGPAIPAAEPQSGQGDMRMDPALPLIFHEIKNYAYTMKGNTHLLRAQMPDGDAHLSIERLERATERIEKLSREVMDMSLVGQPSQAGRVELGSLIRNSAEAYFQGLGLTFAFQSDRDSFPVSGDARKLEQVFLNLFKNALEAGARKIEVSLLAHPGKVGVLLEDDGKGCTPEQIEKMFDAYQSFRRGKGGSGLGLFLVKAIIEGHGGSISGISKNLKAGGGNGMVFVLQFPLAEPQNPQANAATP